MSKYEKQVKKAFDNAYRLIVEGATFDDLGDAFILPENYEDPKVTLEYYTSIENYERCAKIRDKIKKK